MLNIRAFRIPLCAMGVVLGYAGAYADDFGGSNGVGIAPPMQAYFEELDALQSTLGDSASTFRGVVEAFKLWPAGHDLEICFVDGSDALHRLFVEVSQRWLEDTSLTFDFGRPPQYRVCAASHLSDIRVAFDPTAGSWSWVGTDSRKYGLNTASLNIGYAEVPPPGSPSRTELEGTILHEVGHALGFEHEHQSPEAHCDQEFDWAKVYDRYTALTGWPKDKIDFNFRALIASERLLTTPYDRQSIMHYYFEPWMFVRGEASTCFVGHNETLSAIDKSMISAVYPGTPADQDKVLQARADTASTELARLKLNFNQLSSLGVEISNALSEPKRKLAIQFNLAPNERGPAPPGLAPRISDCGVEGTVSAGVTCKVTSDGSSLFISVEPK